MSIFVFFLTDIKRKYYLILSLIVLTNSYYAQADISQVPLLIPSENIPNNLILMPSFEYSTLISLAHRDIYAPKETYSGYFDPFKCYRYINQKQWFEPIRIVSNHLCGRSYEWSGNFLNWAITTKSDAFRGALTGGYRAIDTPELTVLEKTRNPHPNRYADKINNSKIKKQDLRYATPVNSSWTEINMRASNLGTDIIFTPLPLSLTNTLLFIYSKNLNARTSNLSFDNKNQWQNGRLKTSFLKNKRSSFFYRVKARVKVCDPKIGIEENCTYYGSSNYKPEGLIQKYSNRLRYSVFSYLNDSSSLRDGGILRAQQKFVGPNKLDEHLSKITNNQMEWSSSTGVLLQNPDNITKSMGFNINNSGVINYINKFGQLGSGRHKSFAPVSELYYSALRYIKKQENVLEYSTPNPAHKKNPDKETTERWSDKFPVINNWEDPILYECQRNIILGMGNTLTYNDKNLPGNTQRSEEPTTPRQIIHDKTIDVVAATREIAELEGFNPIPTFHSHNNSAYIAGMSYLANTVDQRPDIAGKQTINTYWVDVRENRKLLSKNENQFWLAAKYGSFIVPNDFISPYSNSKPLPLLSWTNGDKLETGDLKPSNFYAFYSAKTIIDNLKELFKNAAENIGIRTSNTSLASNSTQLQTDTLLFQALFDSKYWEGDLLAKTLTSDGTIKDMPLWQASNKLPNHNDRKIFIFKDLENNKSNSLIGKSGINFIWENLSVTQQELMRNNGEGQQKANVLLGMKRLNYIRGSSIYEQTAIDKTKPFRARKNKIGDIVNSDPVFIHQQNFGYANLATTSGGFDASAALAYTEFRNSTSYQLKVPLVIVGANDGMLHGFDASSDQNNSGRELFAVIPNNVLKNLYKLTQPNYSHQYYVDGTPEVSDAYINGTWRTLAIGSTGAGGNSIFAIDITNPANIVAKNILWEYSHHEMGYSLGKPSIVALPNGKFGVLVSSGYNRKSQSNTGYLWLLDAEDGSIIKQFILPNSGDLGAPLAIDLNANKLVDRIYIADTHGQVWRINIQGSSPTQWKSPNAPFFIAQDKFGQKQPITAPLNAAYTENNELIIVFGTGSFYLTSDRLASKTSQVQSMYGLLDRDQIKISREELQKQTILTEITNDKLKGRILSNTPLTLSDPGWVLDLSYSTKDGATNLGERIVSKAEISNFQATFTSLIPSSNPCNIGGKGWIMSIKLNNGGRLPTVYFDYNQDHKIDMQDYITLKGTVDPISVSGISYVEGGAIKGAVNIKRPQADETLLCSTRANGSNSSCTTTTPPSITENSKISIQQLSWQQLTRGDQ